MELWQIPIIIVVGLIAGVINTLAGGGSMLTLPMLILMGLPPSMANGTNRVAIWVQCVIATAGFQKQGIGHLRFGILASIPAVLGAIIGAQISIDIPDALFQSILAVVMLGVVGLTIWNPRPTAHTTGIYSWKRVGTTALVFFLIGIYGGFIQVGVGFILTAALTLVCGFNLVTTAGIKVLTIAIYTTFAMSVFIFHNEINWPIAIVLSVGNGIGGWLGTKIAIQKGEKWIKFALAATVVLLALKLLGILPAFT